MKLEEPKEEKAKRDVQQSEGHMAYQWRYSQVQAQGGDDDGKDRGQQ